MRAAVAPWKLLCLTCIYSASSVGRAFDKPANLISYARAAKDMWKFENVIVVGDHSTELDIDLFFPSADAFSSFQLIYLSDLPAVLQQEGLVGSGHSLVLSLVDLPPLVLRGLATAGSLEALEWHVPRTTDVPGDLSLRLDSRLFLYNVSSRSEQLTLSEIYAIKGGSAMTKHVGEWIQSANGSSTLSVSMPNLFERRKDLSGIVLKNCVLGWEPISFVIKNTDGSLNTTGLLVNLLTNLQQIMQFSMTAYEPGDMLWGGPDENNSYSGIVGDLQKQRGDISTAGLSISLERSTVMDFTISLMSNRIGVMIQDSNQVAVNFWVFIDVFLGLLWFGIIVIMSSLMTGFFFINYFGIERMHMQEDSERFGLLNSCSLVSLVYMQKDYGIEKKTLSTRILYFSTCVSSFIVFAYYTAVLTSWMTAKEPPAPIENFQDLLDKNYKLYYWQDTLPELYLKNLPSSSAGNQLYQKSVTDGWGGGLNDPQTMYDNIQGQSDGAVFEFFITMFGRTNVKYVSIEESYELEGGIGLQKNSEFRKFFNYHLNKQKLTGLMHKNEIKWLTDSNAVSSSDGNDEVTALAYDNLLFPFVTLLAGIILSGIMMGVEKITRVQRVAQWFHHNFWSLINRSVFRRKETPLLQSGGQKIPSADVLIKNPASHKMYAFD